VSVSQSQTCEITYFTVKLWELFFLLSMLKSHATLSKIVGKLIIHSQGIEKNNKCFLLIVWLCNSAFENPT